MKNTVTRLGALLLTAALLCGLLTFAGCGNGCGKKAKDEDFAELASLLIECGVDVCDSIYLGRGLDAEVPDDFVPDPEHGTYYPVDSDRYGSIADLKRAAEAVFAPELAAEWLYGDAFGEYPVSCTDCQLPLYTERDGVLTVNTSYDGETAYGTEWDYDSVTVTELGDETAAVTIDTIYRDETEKTVTVTFVNTPAGWRISSRLLEKGNDVSEWEEGYVPDVSASCTGGAM